jgi:hypothetical protein
MNSNDFASLIFLLVFLVPYFIPSIVALSRGMQNKGSIIVVNLFLGWTFIGWVVALAMACAGKKSISASTFDQTPPPSNLPPPNVGS